MPCTRATASSRRTRRSRGPLSTPGLIWIGPPADAIDALGDKVRARHIADSVGAPLVPGTADPVADADEVVEFARAYGLPIAIKAAFGGGGRGMKVARTLEEIPELFASAVREASPRSAVASASSSATSIDRGTSRRNALPMFTGTSW